jgi:ribosomal protein S18 acetylase RimI-like enzyme
MQRTGGSGIFYCASRCVPAADRPLVMRAENAHIEYRTSPVVSDTDLNRLFAAAWDGHRERAFGPVLSRSLAYVCAFDHDRLIGFVNVAWDGGAHGFVLDTTVSPEYRRRGIGTDLLRRAAVAAARAGLEWLHVDYEPQLDGFYRGCGFRPTAAGLLRLSATPA